MDQWGVGELEIFDVEGIALFNIGAEDGWLFEEGGGNEVVVEGSDLGGEGGLGDGAASGEVLGGEGVEIAEGLEMGKDALSGGGSENGLGCFEMAEMEGAMKEVVGTIAEVVGFEEVGLLGGEIGFGFDDKVNAVVIVGCESFDSRNVAVGFKIEEGEGLLQLRDGWIGQASLGREIAHCIGEESEVYF